MTLKLRNKGMLIVLSSPSGGGKSTVVKTILKKDPQIEYSVSVTSRKPRQGEVNGEAYFFVSEEEFKQMIAQDRFLEWALVHNHYYGTRRDIIEEKLQRNKDVLLDIDVQGGLNIKRKMPESVLIFLLPPSMEVLETRLRKRGLDDNSSIELRLHNAVREIQSASQYDYIVINDKLEDTIMAVRKIIEAERHRTSHLRVIIDNEPRLTTILADRSYSSLFYSSE